ncbi:MAG: hypothetical protein WDW38_007051 [Sanguina aurantia]
MHRQQIALVRKGDVEVSEPSPPTLEEAGGSYLLATRTLMMYRAAVAVYVVVITLVQLRTMGTFVIKYYTFWNWNLLGLYFAAAALASSTYARASGKGQHTSNVSPTMTSRLMHSLPSVVTLLFHVNITTVAIVDITTWTVLFPMLTKHTTPEMAAVFRSMFLNYVSYNQHGANAGLILVDMMLGRLAFFPHMVGYAGLWSLLFVAWANIWHGISGSWLYPFLDTKETWAPLAYGGLYLAHIVFYLAVWGSFWLRGRLLWEQMLAQSRPSRVSDQPGVSVRAAAGRQQQANGAHGLSLDTQTGGKKGL